MFKSLNKKKLKKLNLLLIIFAIFLIFSTITNSESSIGSINTINGTSSTTYSYSWTMNDGSSVTYSINPINSYLQAGQTYSFNVSLKCLGLAPNSKGLTNISTSLMFYNNVQIVYSNASNFNNITKTGQTVIQNSILVIPSADNFSLNSTNYITGYLKYRIVFNELITNGSSLLYDTNWNEITFAYLESNTTVTSIYVDPINYLVSLSILLGFGAIAIVFIVVSNREANKRKLNQIKQQQTINSQLTNATNQTQTPTQQLQIPLQYPQQMYQPQYQPTQAPQQPFNRPQQPYLGVINYKILAKKIPQSQEVVVCRICGSLNAPKIDKCLVCGELLINESLEKSSLKHEKKFLSGSNTFIVLSIITYFIEFVIVFGVTGLYQLLGGSPNLPYDVIVGFIKNSSDYQKWYNFEIWIVIILVLLSTILLDVLPYLLMKREIVKSSYLTIHKIKSLKKYYLTIPIFNFLFLFVLSIFQIGNPSSESYDFVSNLIGICFMAGIALLPTRYWINSNKFNLSNETVNYLVNSTMTTTPVMTNTPFITPSVTQQSKINEPTVPTMVCPNCKNNIELTSRFCPDCGTTIEKCYICKKPLGLGVEVGYCPNCLEPFHMDHLKENIKVSGQCPNCKEPIQDYAILKEKSRN